MKKTEEFYTMKEVLTLIGQNNLPEELKNKRKISIVLKEGKNGDKFDKDKVDSFLKEEKKKKEIKENDSFLRTEEAIVLLEELLGEEIKPTKFYKNVSEGYLTPVYSEKGRGGSNYFRREDIEDFAEFRKLPNTVSYFETFKAMRRELLKNK